VVTTGDKGNLFIFNSSIYKISSYQLYNWFVYAPGRQRVLQLFLSTFAFVLRCYDNFRGP